MTYRKMTEETEIDRTVVILGHSYVRRLKEFIDAGTYTVDHEFNIQNKKIDVRYISIPGAKTQTIQDIVDDMFYKKRFLIILMIGGNDLDGSKGEPGITADKIIHIAKDLQKRGTKYVIISQIIQRDKGMYVNEKIDECNLRLTVLCSLEDKIIFWAHPRINGVRKYLLGDKTNLNQRGNYILYRGLRNGIIHVLKHCENGEPCCCSVKYRCRADGWTRRGKRKHR